MVVTWAALLDLVVLIGIFRLAWLADEALRRRREDRRRQEEDEQDDD